MSPPDKPNTPDIVIARVGKGLAWLLMMAIASGWGVHFGYDRGFQHGVNATIREFGKAVDSMIEKKERRRHAYQL